MSPWPHLGHVIPNGTGRLCLHLGYGGHARNSPNRPVLITIGAPHSLQISSDGLSGTLSRPIGLVKRHSSGYLAQAMNGPKRPVRTTSGLPHVGQRSWSSLDKSCTSGRIDGVSPAPSAVLSRAHK